MISRLDKTHLEAYERDGFVCVPEFFDASELTPLLDAYREDPSVNGTMYGMVDEYGSPHPICIWTELGDDIIGMIPRTTRMVDATEALMGESCYHWHSKMTVKPPGCNAHVDWHQDFASWYDDGVPYPRLLTIGIAIEPTTKANGCLQLVPGSHRIGRMDHNDTGSFSERVKHAQKTLGLVHCEMGAGDAVFFHCNTLHGSAGNESQSSRLMLFASYNAVSNEPLPGAQGANEEGRFMNITAEERAYRPIEKIPDDVLSRRRFKSAFAHTPLKRPITELDGTFTQAAELR